MCFALNVIRSIILLYFLNGDLCHAFDGSGDSETSTTVSISIDEEEDGRIELPNSDSIKRIVGKFKNSSDNKYNYDDIVFGSNSGSDDSYKSLYDYNMNEENVCFLDNLKRNLLWWSHQNGSLVTTGEFFRLLVRRLQNDQFLIWTISVCCFLELLSSFERYNLMLISNSS